MLPAADPAVPEDRRAGGPPRRSTWPRPRRSTASPAGTSPTAKPGPRAGFRTTPKRRPACGRSAPISLASHRRTVCLRLSPRCDRIASSSRHPDGSRDSPHATTAILVHQAVHELVPADACHEREHAWDRPACDDGMLRRSRRRQSPRRRGVRPPSPPRPAAPDPAGPRSRRAGPG